MLRQVSPNDARAYARSKGWEKVPNTKGKYALFRWPATKLDQIIVPADNLLDDYADRIQDVIFKLSEMENRTPVQVLSDVLNHDADTVRCRVVDPQTKQGSIPLGDAASMLDGIRRSLLSAAHSVLRPSSYHPRLSRREALQLVQACRFQQTERGSFIIAVSCPLRAVDSPQLTLLGGTESFTRATTQYLQQSLQRLSEAIQDDDAAKLENQDADGQVFVSANLCDALLRLKPDSEDFVLELSVAWAASSKPEAHRSELIRFTADDMQVVEDIYLRLVQEPQSHAGSFLGIVEELRGNRFSDDQREGEVVIALYLPDEIVRVRAELSPDWYATANTSHMQDRFIATKGIFRRGSKNSRLTEITFFKLLDEVYEPQSSTEPR